MRPADKGGGASDGVDDGVGGAGGGDGVPAIWATVSDDPISPFGGYINLLLSNGDGAGTMPSGSIGGGAPATMPTDLEVLRRTSGLEFFEEVQLGDIWSTQSVNQPASVPIHGLDGQCDDFLDEGCGDDVVDSESDHYDELLVRCEGDTDVEELYPTRAEAVVQDVMSKAEMMKEARVKKAKHKAEKSRAAKRRALEGDVEEEGMTFGDQVSDDCKELIDSSDDDQVVDGNDISLITKKRSRSKKAFKRAYYDESRLNAHDQFQINMCFEDVHQFRRALLNYHVVHQRDWEFLRNDKDRITVNKLKDESIDAWKWLSKIPTKHWARHAMDTICKTDLVVNNISEIFNSYILDQRDKPIVTMMEQIRTKLMAMFAVRRDGVAVAQWEITPHYVEKLETEKRFARWYTPVNAGNGIWQVETCAVNLLNKTCSCRKWDLIGVPCKHAIAVIHMVKEFPEDHVSDFFKRPMYELTYKAMIYPVPGQDDWVKTDTPDIEPPVFATKPGRKKKKRRPSAGEGQDGSVKISTITCSNCKLKGHRYTTCTQPLKPHLAIRKAGHKSNRKLPESVEAAPSTTTSPPSTGPTTASHMPTSPAAPPHQQHVRGAWTGRGRGRHSDHYMNSRSYSYFTAGLEAQQRENAIQDGME